MTIGISWHNYSSYAEGITAKASIEVDKFKTTLLSTRAYPECNLEACRTKTTVSPIQKVGNPFQRLSLALVAGVRLDRSLQNRWRRG